MNHRVIFASRKRAELPLFKSLLHCLRGPRQGEQPYYQAPRDFMHKGMLCAVCSTRERHAVFKDATALPHGQFAGKKVHIQREYPSTGLRTQVKYPPTHPGFFLYGAEKRFRPPCARPCLCGIFPRLERVPCVHCGTARLWNMFSITFNSVSFGGLKCLR